MASNESLAHAKAARDDEFYTQLADVEFELHHYRKHFKDKSVFCNCDDPFESNFFKYFVLNFNRLGLKKLVCTCYAGSPIMGTQLSLFDVEPKAKPGTPYKAVVTTVYDKDGDGGVDMLDVAELFKSGENELTELSGDGDFRSPECLELMDAADIVATNPPFSLFREYVTTLIDHDKKFVIIGPKSGIKYKETFPLIKQNKMWCGITPFSGGMWLIVPKGDRYDKIVDGVPMKNVASCWFTNLDIKKRHENMILYRRYNPEVYPPYTNFDGIDVANTADIPCDWPGNMGVPITFLEQHNPDQFEIVGLGEGNLAKEIGIGRNQRGRTDLEVRDPDGTYRRPWARILIRNKHPEEPRS